MRLSSAAQKTAEIRNLRLPLARPRPTMILRGDIWAYSQTNAVNGRQSWRCDLDSLSCWVCQKCRSWVARSQVSASSYDGAKFRAAHLLKAYLLIVHSNGGGRNFIDHELFTAVVAVRLIVLATNISLLSKILSKRLQESLAFKLAEGILSNNFTQSDKV